MKRLIILLLVCLLFFSFSIRAGEKNNEVLPAVQQFLISRRIVFTDTYEFKFKIMFSNGLSVIQWKEVSKEEYYLYKDVKQE